MAESAGQKKSLDPAVEAELGRLLGEAKKIKRAKNPSPKVSARLNWSQDLPVKAKAKNPVVPENRPLPGQLPGPQPTEQPKPEEQPTPTGGTPAGGSKEPSLTNQLRDSLGQGEKTNNLLTNFGNRADQILKSRGIDPSQDSYFSEAAQGLKTAVTSGNKLKVLTEAAKLGFSLRRGIAEGSFSAFIVVIILAVIKDLWDILDPSSITGDIVNVFISVALFIVVSFQGTWFKRWLVKKFLGKYIMGMLAEFIPGVAIFPTYTIMVLLVRWQNRKEIKKYQEALEELELEMKKLQ
ncbi:MAG: hypothetical protein NTZ18_04220 [Candidatus Komeilibacteria bacterium]|nr:hypothetical protein [Candidatus Komeilibacteria bacterium]